MTALPERLDAPTTTPATAAPTPVPADAEPGDWLTVCPVGRLQANRGAAALIGDVQVAVFRLGDGTVHAVGNIDPFSGAGVMSRGLVGDRGGEPTVASPVYKQAFSLRDGRCLDDDTVSLPAFAVRVVGPDVQVGIR